MEYAKHAAMQITAGGSAGLVEVSLMHPLDLIKTRFQIQRGIDDPDRYKSLIDCFKRIYRSEGIFSFYKGILPPILAETPKRATKTFSLAGLCSGLTEAMVICPFEVVKVKLQAERNVTVQQKSTLLMAKEIFRFGGLGNEGLYKGLTATLMRHGVWNMVYFGLYHSVKQKKPAPQDPALNFLYRFMVGLAAGTIASVANIPFDVAKSRIQGPQPVPGQIKYRACVQSMLLVYREEGFAALYKGLVPKVMRLGPGGAIMLLVYEHVYEFLQGHFL